jgi:hypothetical protein
MAEPDAPRSGILRSNVEELAPQAPERPGRSGSPLIIVLVGLLTFVAGAGLMLLLTTNRSQPAAPKPAPPTAAPQVGIPGAAGGRPASAPLGPLPAVNGISCDALESTVVHIHLHLAIFINGAEQQVPLGIGIGQPWQVSNTADGPFVEDGTCFYWIHTHTEDGIIHIESPVRRSFTLGDFFAIWQVPLTARQVGPAQGEVIVYVNGQRDGTNPADIRLLPHQRIQLDVGGDVPPYSFDFPPGD